MKASRRTAWAKRLYWLSGTLSHVKTYQRYWVLRTDDMKTNPGGWHWFHCRLSTRLLEWSLDLDPKHWDHWALAHADCEGLLHCAECGGSIHAEDVIYG